jgi:hypothetical protein
MALKKMPVFRIAEKTFQNGTYSATRDVEIPKQGVTV